MNTHPSNTSISERRPVTQGTYRGYARQISERCISPSEVKKLGSDIYPSTKQISSKKGRHKVIREISTRLRASVCAHKANPQAYSADWIVLVSNGDRAISVVHIFLSLKPKKPIELSTLTLALLSKHCVERLVERWRISELSDLIATLEPALGWLQLAARFMQEDGTDLPLPLPDGFLRLRRNIGEVPTVITAFDRGSFSTDSEILWRGLGKNGELFKHPPKLFGDPDRVSIKHYTDFAQMGACGAMEDIMKEVRRLTG